MENYLQIFKLIISKKTTTSSDKPIVTMSTNHTSKIKINPIFFKELSYHLSFDLSSVPAIHTEDFIKIFSNLEKNITPALEKSIFDVSLHSLKDLKRAVSSDDAYLMSLFTKPAKDIIASKFRCIVNHLLSLSTEKTEDNLSAQELSLVQTISSIQGCRYGQNIGILESYQLNRPPLSRPLSGDV
jgi:hypothetical protein